MSMTKGLVAGSIAGAVLMVGTASAATTGTVTAVSEYMWRGLSTSNGAAVQGSLDWSSDSGLYAGVWGSNTAPLVLDGTEVDFYGGYKFKLSDVSNIDVGAIYYAFPETQEFSGLSIDVDYPEIYAGLNYAGFSGKLYYAVDSFFGDLSDYAGSPGDEAWYLNLAYGFDIKEGLNLKAAIGYQDGDGVEAAYGVSSPGVKGVENVFDYSITLTKALENGFAASFALVGSDIDTDNYFNTGVGFSDDPKFVIGLSKGFEI